MVQSFPKVVWIYRNTASQVTMSVQHNVYALGFPLFQSKAGGTVLLNS